MGRFNCTYRKVQLSAKWHNSIITTLAMEDAIRHYNILEPNSWRCRHGNKLPEPDLSSASVEQILIALLLKVLVDQSMLCNQTGVDYFLQSSVSMGHVNKKTPIREWIRIIEENISRYRVYWVGVWIYIISWKKDMPMFPV